MDGTNYALVGNGFNAGLFGFFNDDFDYSGHVDGTDYSLIDNAFNSQDAPLSFGPIGLAVPEPGTIAIAALAMLGFVPFLRRQLRLRSLCGNPKSLT